MVQVDQAGSDNELQVDFQVVNVALRDCKGPRGQIQLVGAHEEVDTGLLQPVRVDVLSVEEGVAVPVKAR